MPFRKSKLYPGKVIPGEEDHQIWRTKWCCASVIAENEKMDKLFESVVNKALCWESYSFIKEVYAFEHGNFGTVEERHAQLVTLLQMYIAPGCSYEVNISHAMQKLALKNKSFDVFKQKTEDDQKQVLHEQRNEILSMLNQNLVQCLHRHPEFMSTCSDIEEANQLEDMAETGE
ncbi:unnamed protein product [Chrysoparadoxa australica]